MIRFCIILGAMKAGTTSLFNYLAQHPEIAPCKTKEPNFFSQEYHRGIDYYYALWHHECINNKIMLEASTSYAKYPNTHFSKASDNIAIFAKEQAVHIKFIYLLRNPIDRLESQYNHALKENKTGIFKNNPSSNQSIINISRYALQLDQYFDKFDAENILLLDFDELKDSPALLLKKVCVFLDIDPTFQFRSLGEKFNASQINLANKKIGALYRTFPCLEAISRRVPKRFKKTLLQGLMPVIKPRLFRLSPTHKNAIHEALKEDMTRLHDKYGINTHKWGF